ncbi:MAG TPA: hypothetical protein VF192_01425 [Longimicrobiales bacterium]
MSRLELTDEREDAIYAAQAAWIRERFGEDRAANFGWGVDELTREVQTKVYGDDGGVLVSWVDENEEVIHEFEEFA